MTVRDRLALAAAVAVGLASAALVPVFEDLGWLVRVLLAVAVVAGGATLARRLRAPRLLEPVVGALALGLYVCLAFASPTLTAGLVPGAETVRALGDLVGLGLLDVEELAPPVPTNDGLVLLAALGAGGIAVLVDLVAVTLRQPAVAGLPLLALFAVPAAVLPDGLGWLPFALGAAGWLGLLLADGSDAVSRWGTPLRTGRAATRDPSLGRVGRRIGATALGVAVIVPALVPGLDSRLLGGGSGGEGTGGSRSRTTYNPILELGGQLRLPEPGRLLLRYTTDDAAPDYLRLTTLDRFDEDSGWSASELSADPEDDLVSDGIPVPLSSSSTPVQPVTTTVDLVRLDGPWLPAPLGPRDIDVEGSWLWDEDAQTVFSSRVSLSDVEDDYVVRSERAVPTPELLRGATGVPTSLAETYATAPVVSPYVAELLDELTAGLTNDYDQVAAVQALFRDRSNGFRYSEDASVPGFNAPDALENFLKGKQGFCEQYASAMAAMVRALGIPARVAVGFTQGTQVADGRWEVTTSDAHAWPEVWFSGTGWVRFEPTPRSVQVTTPGVHDRPAARARRPDRQRRPGRPAAGRLRGRSAGRAGPRRRHHADRRCGRRLRAVRAGPRRAGRPSRRAGPGRRAVAAGGAPAPAPLALPRAAGRLGAAAGRRHRRGPRLAGGGLAAGGRGRAGGLARSDRRAARGAAARGGGGGAGAVRPAGRPRGRGAGRGRADGPGRAARRARPAGTAGRALRAAVRAPLGSARAGRCGGRRPGPVRRRRDSGRRAGAAAVAVVAARGLSRSARGGCPVRTCPDRRPPVPRMSTRRHDASTTGRVRCPPEGRAVACATGREWRGLDAVGLVLVPVERC